MEWHTRWMEDLRQAVQSLRRRPAFTAAAIGTLALAIGVNAGMFSVVKTVLLDPLPYANQDRLMFVASSAPGSGFPDEFGASNEMFVEFKAQSKLIEDLSTILSFTATPRVPRRSDGIVARRINRHPEEQSDEGPTIPCSRWVKAPRQASRTKVFADLFDFADDAVIALGAIRNIANNPRIRQTFVLDAGVA